MGTPEFAVPSLKACLEVGEVVGVVTQADKPKGRGQALAPPPVKVFAGAHHLRVMQPLKVRDLDFFSEIESLKADVAVVAAYGKILPKDLLQAPRWGCLNIHASLLPRFRGAAPIQWAIALGEQVTGVCLMQMEEGLDTGPVFSRRELKITPVDTSETLHVKLAILGADLITSDLPRVLEGSLRSIPQASRGTAAEAPYAPMIRKEEGKLDFFQPAEVLECRIRAFTPWPGTHLVWGGEVLKIHRSEVVEGRGEPGTVLSVSPGLDIACGQNALRLIEVQPAGRRRVPVAEFLQSRKILVGTRL